MQKCDRRLELQILSVRSQGDDKEAREYIAANWGDFWGSVDEAIKSCESRTSDVKSITDPAFFKNWAEPLERLQNAFLEGWDRLRTSETSMFVCISSRKFGFKAYKLKRPKASLDDAAQESKPAKRQAKRKLEMSEVEKLMERVVGRSTATVGRLVSVVEGLRAELCEAKEHIRTMKGLEDGEIRAHR